MRFPGRKPCCSSVGGHQVDGHFSLQNKTCKYLVKQADVSYWSEISKLCSSHRFGQHVERVEHHDRGTVP